MERWLIKTEPETYSIGDLATDHTTEWNGVRNSLAQQYMRQMEVGDPVLVYHSGKEKAVVGVAEVVREKYLDPNDAKGKAVCVEFAFKGTLDRPIALSEIRATSKLKDMALVKISRLSVMPIRASHWNTIIEMSHG